MQLRRILKTGLCSNDLNIQVEILKRALRSTGFDGNQENNEFTRLDYFMSGVETVNPVSRMFLKGIDDKVTHLFYFMFSTRLRQLEPHRTFLKYRSELYRLREVLNHNEADRFLVFFCEYRGTDTESEAEV